MLDFTHWRKPLSTQNFVLFIRSRLFWLIGAEYEHPTKHSTYQPDKKKLKVLHPFLRETAKKKFTKRD